jgi:F0F1-type ATP synthase membrane subunit a
MNKDKGEPAFNNIDEILANKIISHTQENVREEGQPKPEPEPEKPIDKTPESPIVQHKETKRSNNTLMLWIIIVTLVVVLLWFTRNKKHPKSEPEL